MKFFWQKPRFFFFLLPALLLVLAGCTIPANGYCAADNVLYIDNGILTSAASSSPDGDCKKIEPAGQWLSRYTDYPKGYSLVYPNDMIIDVTFSPLRTVFSNDTTRIEVYYDNFANTVNDPETYISYGKDLICSSPYHQVLADETFWQNGCKVHLLQWNRQHLKHITNDKNHYVLAEIVKNSTEVYTIFLKSSQPIENAMDYISSFSFVPQKGNAGFYPSEHPSLTPLNAETQNCYHTYFDSQSPLRWGIFEPSAPENLDPLLELENKLNYHFSFVIRYQTVDERLPLYGLTQAFDDKRIVELTMQTLHPEKDSSTIIYEILDGRYDDYWEQYAEKLKSFNHPILFRLNNEMNGDWCRYSSYYTAKDTEVYKALWRYLHQFFASKGVENIIWVWNPHDKSFPCFSWNNGLMYYPGDEFVDIVGMTGYNTGTYFPGEKWRNFIEIYQPLYAQYTSAFHKPLMITEFGSNSVGGNKAAWLQEMFTQLPNYPQIKVAIWWSGVDYDAKDIPGRIYKLNETEEYTRIFREKLAGKPAITNEQSKQQAIAPLSKNQQTKMP